VLHFKRRQPWMTDQVKFLILSDMGVVFLQIVVGVFNLLLFIPPWLTVLHQSLAIILLAINLRLFFVAHAVARSGRATVAPQITQDYRAVELAKP
jgi:heme A synthase